MAWMNTLYQTYEYMKNMESEDDFENRLPIIAHMPMAAQLEIALTVDGEFISASVVDKTVAETIIPVTESSSMRSSGLAAHALCDFLSYIAGDMTAHGTNLGLKKQEEKFKAYKSQLKLWSESAFSTPKVTAIYNYIEKECVISDLIVYGVLESNDGFNLSDGKIQGKPYERVMVRFRVNGSGTWEDMDLMDAYTRYYSTIQVGKRDICYLTGEEKVIADKHPKGILPYAYGAKLISSADKVNFTYRGRFEEASEAFGLGYEESQKIHSTLAWLAKRQGVTIGAKDRTTYICWSPNGRNLPEFIQNDVVPKIEDEELLKTEEMMDSEKGYSKRLYRALAGYEETLSDNEKIALIALEAATPGRLSITYYSEQPAKYFFSKLEKWYAACNWYVLCYKKEIGIYYEIQSPSIKQMIACAWGTERTNFIEADEKLQKSMFPGMIRNITENAPVSRELVRRLTENASRPQNYSSWNYERLLSTACAVIRSYHKSKGKEYKMQLDKDNNERNYLFGRLLALAEKIERRTYEKERDKSRIPNAIRYQTAFVSHPLHTWGIIEKQLIPYYNKLSPGLSHYYKKEVADILSLIQKEDIEKLNNRLDETYLLGYYMERMELNKKRTINTEEI